MEKRKFTKFAAKTIVAHSVNSITQQVVRKFAPKTEDFMVPQISGALAGYYVSERFETEINTLVDSSFDALAKSKNTN